MYLKFRKQLTKNATNQFLPGNNMISAWRKLCCPYSKYTAEIERAKAFAIELFTDVWKMPIEFEVHDIVYSADIGTDRSMPYAFNTSAKGFSLTPHANYSDDDDFDPDDEEYSDAYRGGREAYIQRYKPQNYMLISQKNQEQYLIEKHLPSSKPIRARPVLWAGQAYAVVLRPDLRGTGIKSTGDYLGPCKDRFSFQPVYSTSLGVYDYLGPVVYFASTGMILDAINYFRPELLDFFDQRLLNSLDKTEFHYICNSNHCERTSAADTARLQQFLDDNGFGEYDEGNIQSPVIRPCSLEKWVSTWGIDYLRDVFGFTPDTVTILEKRMKSKLLEALL